MRQTKIFAGSSHPALVKDICNRLGQDVSSAELGVFANGETKVSIKTSIRDQDVFIVQSGSPRINDSIMELLVMISACKSGSARSTTAVMPYFPYSRHSKKKSHRGSITARMIANLLRVAGVDHVITIDLHASQMQGFFQCPVDNLVAEPLIAHWIKKHIDNWHKAVVVSKNPGGTKRVTSLADALKLSFGIVMTDRKRPNRDTGRDSMSTSIILEKPVHRQNDILQLDPAPGEDRLKGAATISNGSMAPSSTTTRNGTQPPSAFNTPPTPTRSRQPVAPSPLRQQHEQETAGPAVTNFGLTRSQTAPAVENQYASGDNDDDNEEDDGEDDDDDDDEDDSGSVRRPRDVVTGRLVHGHIVDDDAPSPDSNHSSGVSVLQFNAFNEQDLSTAADPMMSSLISTTSSFRANGNQDGLGGSGDVASSDDEDENLRKPEAHVTLVGNVRDKPVLIVDDMIDKAASWIAAAETVVKRGGATSVYCFATHGLFGTGCLEDLEACDYIDEIIVTNSFPIPTDAARQTSKLRVLDVSALLAEAIRRNHHGESMSQLYMHYD